MNNFSEIAFRRVEYKTLNDQVYEELRHVIMSGLLQPGSPVTIRGLAAQLGTSMMPVRDALRRLLADRILEMDGQRRYRLRLLSKAEFEEILALRLDLEGSLVERAAAHATEDDIKTIEDIQSRLEDRSERNENFLDLNQEFHFTLYAFAGKPMTLGLVESLWLQAGPLLNHYRLQNGGETAIRHHRSIIDALKRRDPAAARAAIQSDLRDAARVILWELPS